MKNINMNANKWNKNKRKEGKVKQVNLTFTKLNFIDKLNNLKISKISFFEKALDLLDENGEIHANK